MTDPENLGAVAGITGGIAATGWALLKMWKQFFSDRADVANSQSEIQMLKEYQQERDGYKADIARLVERLDAKDAQIMKLMEEKLTAQSDLKSALDKIQFMSEQIESLKQEIASLRISIGGNR